MTGITGNVQYASLSGIDSPNVNSSLPVSVMALRFFADVHSRALKRSFPPEKAALDGIL